VASPGDTVGSPPESAGPPPDTVEVPPDTVEVPPAYSATVRRIGPELRDRMRFSHHAGCPVPLEDLRHLRMRYLAFDGRVRIGELVAHKDYADDVSEVFGRLYDERWPIRRMRLVDAYGGDDDRSAGARVGDGVIRSGDVVVRGFAGIGWEWGGDWSSAKDYQHFSASGG